jgi:GT2 family glycosyltransferase
MPLLHEQLEALAAQTYSGAWDIVISDNGSTDDLVQYLHGPRVPGGLTITCVDSASIQGAAHARNVAVSCARGDFIAFADADDRVRPGWLDAMAQAASHADFVAGAVETGVINTPRVAEWRPMQPPEEGWEVRGWHRAAVGASMGAWKDVHEAIGGFDTTFTVGGDDNDYAWRCQIAGYSAVFAPDALVDYRLRDSYKGLWRQTYGYGRAAVANYERYRGQGLRGYNQPLLLPIMFITLAVRNPLLPKRITRLTTGRWIYYVAHEAGKIRESIARRVVCL